VSAWKPTKDENPDLRCRKCGSHEIMYRKVEDSYGHEDLNYWCKSCGRQWRIYGIDS